MLIKNAIIFDKGKREVDLLIKDGVIKNIDKSIKPTEKERVLDAKGLYLIPSIVDLNISIKNNLFNLKNLDELCREANSGGVGTFVLNSDFSPKLENETKLELLKANLDNRAINIILSISALNSQGKLNNISSLINGGASIIDFHSEINSNLIKQIMFYSKLKRAPLFCYCLNNSFDENGVINDGEISFKLGLGGISKIAEISEVAKIVQMAIEFDVKIIFKTISTSKSLNLINRAKKENLNIYSEVSINNLVLNENSCDNFNTNAKLMPPLREEEERKKLIKDLQKGKIDIITSGHSPKSIAYKDISFTEASFGSSTISDFLAIAYTNLVKRDIISMEELINLISINPAKILGINNKIEIGNRVKFILFDKNYKYSVDNRNSIYDKKELFGRIIDVNYPIAKDDY